MTEIDWNAPLEAVHDDGRVVSVTKSRGWECADADGEYRLDGIPESMYAPYFSSTGRGDDPSWQIRNRTTKPANAPSPEFMQSVKALAKGALMQWSSGVYHDHAKAILAELEPKPDALDEEFDKWIEGYCGKFDPEETNIRFTANEMRKAFKGGSAIKRVRAEKG